MLAVPVVEANRYYNLMHPDNQLDVRQPSTATLCTEACKVNRYQYAAAQLAKLECCIPDCTHVCAGTIFISIDTLMWWKL